MDNWTQLPQLELWLIEFDMLISYITLMCVGLHLHNISKACSFNVTVDYVVFHGYTFLQSHEEEDLCLD